MDYLISVIIPVFNCEQYLNQSIRSLLNQTIFDKIEFIFVDDGSRDRSYEILRTYKDKYDNFVLLHQENKGVSAARNKGIDFATGNYITFFDADDIAESTLYEELISLLYKNNADLSCVNYVKCFSDGVRKVQKEKVNEIYCDSEVLKSFFLSNVLCNNTIDKLFNLSIVGNLRFPEGYTIGEDMYFVFMYLLKCKKIAVNTTKTLYQYNIRNNSAMKSEFSEKYFDSVDLAKKMMNCVPIDSDDYLLAEANWIHEMCKTMGLYYKRKTEKNYQKIDEYKKYTKEYSLTKAYKYLNKKHFIALILMRLNPNIYIYIRETTYRIISEFITLYKNYKFIKNERRNTIDE